MLKRIAGLGVVAMAVVLVAIVVGQVVKNNRLVNGELAITAETRTWTFGDTGVQLIQKVDDSRADGLIDWTSEVRCHDGSVQPWTWAVGYEASAFEKSFEAIRAEYHVGKGWIRYSTRDNSYQRPSGCSDKSKSVAAESGICSYINTVFGLIPLPADAKYGCDWVRDVVKDLPDIQLYHARAGSTHEEDAYDYVFSTDMEVIPIPKAVADKDAYLKEEASHERKEIPSKPVNIKVSSEAVVPEWSWVIAQNDVMQKFSNGSRMLKAGDACGLEFGGLITVVELRGQDLLVEYTAPGDPFGTPCPSDVLFTISASEFAAMSEQYAAKLQAQKAEKELVQRLLAKNFYGETKDAGEWSWVDVMNVDPVTQEFSNGSGLIGYGGSCGIGRADWGNGHVVEGGTMQVRGQEGGRVLYEYMAKGEPKGTPCPSNVLFFGN